MPVCKMKRTKFFVCLLLDYAPSRVCLSALPSSRMFLLLLLCTILSCAKAHENITCYQDGQECAFSEDNFVDIAIVTNWQECSLFGPFWTVWTVWTVLDHFGPFGPFCTVWTVLDHLDQFGLFGPFGPFGPFWTVWTVLDHFGPFGPF